MGKRPAAPEVTPPGRSVSVSNRVSRGSNPHPVLHRLVRSSDDVSKREFVGDVADSFHGQAGKPFFFCSFSTHLPRPDCKSLFQTV